MRGIWLLVLAWSVAVAVPPTADAQEPLRLEEVVRSALATHPSLEASRARVSAAGHGVGEARSAWWPWLGLTGTAVRYQEPMVVAPLHGIDPMNPPEFDRSLVQGHVSVEWTLFDGGARGAGLAAAAMLAEAAESGLRATRDAVVQEAVSAYLAVLTSRAVMAAHELRMASLEAERSRVEQLFGEGRVPRVQVLRTEAGLSRATAEREAALEEAGVALRRLARVSGLPGLDGEAPRLAELAPAPLPAQDREELLAEARASHPAVAQASRRAAAAAAAHAGVRSHRLPRVSAVARYSAYGSGATSVQPEWNVGTQLSYAVFSGGARARAVDRAAAEAEAARAELAGVVRVVEDGVDAALAATRSSLARVRALAAAVAQSEEVARIEALALESGAGVQTDYLSAEAELLWARAALAGSRHAAVEARIRLALAAGRLDPARLGDLVVEVEP